jgi:hypothetical protein
MGRRRKRRRRRRSLVPRPGATRTKVVEEKYKFETRKLKKGTKKK